MPSTPDALVPLAPLTTWKIGGPAEWFTAPETETGLVEAVHWARENAHSIHILGRGSNVLIADEGLKGLVICTRNLTVESRDKPARHMGDESRDKPARYMGDESRGKPARYMEVSAGMSLPRLAKEVAGLGFSGYEFYIGIPGTVGGAVVMNAGFGPGDERQTANRCLEIQTLNGRGVLSWKPYAAVNPEHRHTDLLGSGEIVLRARFRLERESSREAIRAETARHLAMRKSKQPLTRPTAGSVFRGTREGIPAAVYIDRCGLKGFRKGGAVISEKHANWIENTGGARAQDVLELIRHVQEVVLHQEGIQLEPEVQFLH